MSSIPCRSHQPHPPHGGRTSWGEYRCPGRPESSDSPGRELARKRWDRPDNITARYERLAEHIRAKVATLPPLTEEQKQKLTAIINN